MKYKIFCDESNHLANDSSNLMVIGGIICPNEQVEYFGDINIDFTIIHSYESQIMQLTDVMIGAKRLDFIYGHTTKILL